MNTINDWSRTNIDRLRDYLYLYGDLVLKSGQEAIRVSSESLPDDPTHMNDWCNHWLKEGSEKKILEFIDFNSN